MTRTVFIYSEKLWERGFGPQHPLKPERLKRTYKLLSAYNAFDGKRSRVVPPRPATEEELALFHTPEYIKAVQRLSRGEKGVEARRYNFGPGDNPVFPGMYESAGLKVGGAIRAAELLLDGEAEIAFNFSGGLHHAGPDHASGFCIFNDAAVVIHYLLRHGLRVAYVDIDAHHGDGVQAAFYDTDQVLTISIHESGEYLFPGSGFPVELGTGPGWGYAANLPLAPRTSDAIYLWAFAQIVPPLVARFSPDIIVSQLGVDTHYQDPLAHLSLTTCGYEALVRAIKELGTPWLALGGGGYDLSVVPRAWTLAYGVMNGQEFPDELPPAYATEYGSGRLHDANSPTMDEETEERAWRYARMGVKALQDALRIPAGQGPWH
jgi:acetoin utilization protein AcuC